MQFPPSTFSTLVAFQIIVANDGAILFYSGTPAHGNLVISLAPQSGTDRFGNSYPAGLNIQQGSSQIVIDAIANVITQQFITGNAGVSSPAEMLATAVGNTVDVLTISSAISATEHDSASLLLASNNSVSNSGAEILMQYTDTTSAVHDYLTMGLDGINVTAGAINAVQPGTGGSLGSPAVAETWHLPTLQTGWSQIGGSDPALQYRLMADSDCVKVWGSVAFTGTPAANTVIFQLPSGYHSTRVFVTNEAYDTVNMSGVPVEIDTSGNVKILTSPGANPHIFIDMNLFLNV